MTVNGRMVSASIEPRTHLADFLRDALNLTGTHLGCEHGVCGACTLLVDGVPVRSCITYAAACAGSRVTTIEGLDDDDIVAELRESFTREHALQCGYCTPAMLITARDLVLRLETPDERSIRLGLSGNLCRCTGYVGIVRAVRSVIAQRRERGMLPIAGAGRELLGPAGARNKVVSAITIASRPAAKTEYAAQRALLAADIPDFVPKKVFDDHFTVAAPADVLFELFGDVRRIAACLPGALVMNVPAPDRVEGIFRIRFGPISADFQGAARIEHHPETRAGRIVGAGKDQRSGSSTQGQISYHLVPIERGAATRVELSIGYSLQGLLAQIAREGLVRDLAQRLIAEFAHNLDRSVMTGTGPAEQARPLDGLAMVWGLFRSRLRRILRMIWAR
jgi:carbon-monoxide dehydrogenase small subunit